MLKGIITWLNNNSGAIIAVAAGIIAWFSYVNLRLTKWQGRFLKWEDEKDRRNRQPILVLVEEMFSRERVGYYVDILVANVGYGPAVNIVSTILRKGEAIEEFGKHIPINEPLAVRPLGQGERTVAYRIPLKDAPLPRPIMQDAIFFVRILYEDIFGNRYETRYEHGQYSMTQKPQKKASWEEEEGAEKR